MPHSRTARWTAAGLLTAAGLCVAAVAARSEDPDALWKIVHDRCVPNQQQHGDPAPCAAVDIKNGLDTGYAVLKDRNGATQFLLIPTQRIVGIESPALLAPDAPNYFADAWEARHYVEKALGRPAPAEDLSLAVNSILARTQHQLHIHIDCIDADVRRVLDAERSNIGEHWAPLGQPIGGHPYLAMRVTGTTLDGHNPFKLLADGVPGAGADMTQRTLVVVGMMFDGAVPGFVILTDHIDLLHADFAAGARLQDHACTLVRQSADPVTRAGAAGAR
jgi:CDP-diacylglycerol pyrophosphatase